MDFKLKILLETAKAMAHLHNYGIMHRYAFSVSSPPSSSLSLLSDIPPLFCLFSPVSLPSLCASVPLSISSVSPPFFSRFSSPFFSFMLRTHYKQLFLCTHNTRDLKTSNLLLTGPDVVATGDSSSGSDSSTDSDSDSVVKVTDFGVSVFLKRSDSLVSKGPIGTPVYMV